jgi:predicted Rossmann-fold nucleotide-binding protein
LAQLGLHEKPCGVLNVAGYFDRMLSMVDYAIHEGFLKPEHGAMILVAESPAVLLDMMDAYRAPHLRKWIDRAAT